MGCRYFPDVPCIGMGWKDIKYCSGYRGHSKPCGRYMVHEERRLAFLDKIKTISLSSKATPTRNKS